jgi:FixJ family two-component response regulator
VESAIEGMKRGAFDYLMKPCELDNLIEKLNIASDKKREHETRILEARATLIGLRRGD